MDVRTQGVTVPVVALATGIFKRSLNTSVKQGETIGVIVDQTQQHLADVLAPCDADVHETVVIVKRGDIVCRLRTRDSLRTLLPACVRNVLSDLAQSGVIDVSSQGQSGALDEIEEWCTAEPDRDLDNRRINCPYFLAELESKVADTICPAGARMTRRKAASQKRRKAKEVAFHVVRHIASLVDPTAMLCTNYMTITPTRCDALVQSSAPIDGLSWHRLASPPAEGIELISRVMVREWKQVEKPEWWLQPGDERQLTHAELSAALRAGTTTFELSAFEQLGVTNLREDSVISDGDGNFYKTTLRIRNNSVSRELSQEDSLSRGLAGGERETLADALAARTEFSITELHAFANGNVHASGLTTLTPKELADFSLSDLRPRHYVEVPSKDKIPNFPFHSLFFQPAPADAFKFELIEAPCDTPEGAKEVTRSNPLLAAYEEVVKRELYFGEAPQIIHNKRGCWSAVLTEDGCVIGGATFRLIRLGVVRVIMDVEITVVDKERTGASFGKQLANFLKAILVSAARPINAMAILFLQAAGHDKSAAFHFWERGAFLGKEDCGQSAMDLANELKAFDKDANQIWRGVTPMVLFIDWEMYGPDVWEASCNPSKRGNAQWQQRQAVVTSNEEPPATEVLETEEKIAALKRKHEVEPAEMRAAMRPIEDSPEACFTLKRKLEEKSAELEEKRAELRETRAAKKQKQALLVEETEKLEAMKQEKLNVQQRAAAAEEAARVGTAVYLSLSCPSSCRAGVAP